MLTRLDRIEDIGLDDFAELMDEYPESVTRSAGYTVVSTLEFIAFSSSEGACVRVNYSVV